MSNRCTISARAAIIVGVSLATWFAVLSGFLSSPDGLIYDLAIRAATSLRPVAGKRVLLVEHDTVGADDTLTKVLKRISDFEPAAIGVCFPVANSTQRISRQISTPLVFLDPQSRTAYKTGKRIRTHAALNDGAAAPSFESRLVHTVDPNIKLPTGPFGINFRGNGAGLPLINEIDVLSGNLVREIVANRIVLIGWTDERVLPRIATAASGRNGMSLLEIRGHVVETLFAEDAIRTVSWTIQILLVLIAAALGCLCGQIVRMRWALAIAVVAIATLGVVAGVLLCWQQLWIPCAPLFTALVLSVAMTSFYRARQDHADLRRGRTVQLASEWGWSANSKRSWKDVAELIRQLIDVDNLVLLELPGDSIHTSVAYTKGITESQILEKRRDRKRNPYLDSVESGEPTRLARPFFRSSTGEDQYMVALIHNGNVAGFLVVGLPVDRLRKDNLLRRLSQSAPEIAALVAPMRSTANASRKSGEGADADGTHQPALAVYDLFGRMEMMNVRMAALCAQLGIDSDRGRLLDTLKQLMVVDQREVNRRLSTVILDGEFVVCSINTPGSDFRSILKITPISRPATPFDVEAIGVVIFPANARRSAWSNDANHVERIGQPALFNAARLWSQAQGATDSPINNNLVASRANRSDQPGSSRPVAYPPTDFASRLDGKPGAIAAHELRGCLLSIAEELQGGEWQFETASPMLPSRVAVESQLVGATLDAILRFMVDDLPNKSTLRVSHVETDSHLQIDLRATRNIESVHEVDPSPSQHESPTPACLKRIRSLQNQLDRDGARLKINRTPFEVLSTLTLPKIPELAKSGISSTETTDTIMQEVS